MDASFVLCEQRMDRVWIMQLLFSVTSYLLLYGMTS